MGALKVAIIGAGPAGCTLARLLILESVQVVIFEGDKSPDFRSQGGTLDLHNHTGLAALKAAGLYDEFLQYARFDGESLLVTDKKLLAYLRLRGETKSTSHGRPEIDRSQLRRILFESLPSTTIRWGYRLKSVGKDLTLNFDQGTESGFDLIIGADGAWSKVRPLLTSQVPVFSGVSGLGWAIADAEKRYPDLYELVNKGSLFSWSDGREISGQQMGDGSIHCSSWATRDEQWIKNLPFDIHDAKAVKAALAEEYHDWAPPLLKLTQAADESSFVARNLYMLPQGNRWENKPGVTLIGDAAHVTVPFAGEGVNLAMEDAMKLSRVIIEADKADNRDALVKGIKDFEDDMFKRAAHIQKMSIGNMEDMFFTPGAPRTSIENFVIRGMSTQFSGISLSILSSLAYVYFWVFKIFY